MWKGFVIINNVKYLVSRTLLVVPHFSKTVLMTLFELYTRYSCNLNVKLHLK